MKPETVSALLPCYSRCRGITRHYYHSALQDGDEARLMYACAQCQAMRQWGSVHMYSNGHDYVPAKVLN